MKGNDSLKIIPKLFLMSIHFLIQDIKKGCPKFLG